MQFTPPADARPAELEVLVTEKATNAGVTATLLDLAQRGALTIRQVEGGRHGDWRLEFPEKPPGDMEKWERHLYNGIATKGRATTTRSQLSEVRYSFATVAAAHRAAALRSATREGLVHQSAGQADDGDEQVGRSSRWGSSVAGLIVAIPFAIGAVVVGLFVAGLAMLLFGRKMPARSARGQRGAGGVPRVPAVRRDRRARAHQGRRATRGVPPLPAVRRRARAHRPVGPHLPAGTGRGGRVRASLDASGGVAGRRARCRSTHSFSSFTSGLAGSMSVQSSSSGGAGFSSVGGGGGGGGGGSW